jgi:uncharacterized protein
MRNIIFSGSLALSACNSLFYQGDNKPWHPPESRNISCNRSQLRSDDQTQLQTMHCPTLAPQERGVIVQFHGNAQNMNAHYLYLAWLIGEGYSLATFDYRGYGESEGLSDREGVHSDARAYIRHTRATFSARQRIYYGQSLGGAILMAALLDEGLREDEVYVFEGTFSSYRRAARTVLASKWFLYPLQWLAYILVTDSKSPSGSLSAFESTQALLIHGDRDPVVEFSHGEILAAEKTALAHCRR